MNFEFTIMLTIRFLRQGKKHQPFFKVVVIDKRRSPRSGKFVEEVGFYNPLTKEKRLNKERILYWLSKGVTTSDSVHNLLVKEGVIKGKKIPVHSAKKQKKESSSHQVTESPSEQATEPPTEQKTESSSEQATESSSEQSTEPRSEQVSKPSSGQGNEQVAESQSEQGDKSSSDQVTE